MRDLANRLLCRPPVQLFGAAVPVGDDVMHVTHENGVVREIEEVGLLPQLLFRPLSVLDVGSRSIPFDNVS